MSEINGTASQGAVKLILLFYHHCLVLRGKFQMQSLKRERVCLTDTKREGAKGKKKGLRIEIDCVCYVGRVVGERVQDRAGIKQTQIDCA